ncbi:MAG: DUF2207 domain-containing protein [Streptosporangiales bacterium]|nr:DUF2207 domain-containing protein [Streptosporangiales bacterium]
MLGFRWGRRLLIAVVAGAAITALGAAPASASSAGSLASDDIQFTLRKDGVLTARETITYDYGSAANSAGIERSFVTRQRYDEGNDRVYRVQNVKASSPDGAPTKTTVETGESATTVTVGAGQSATGRKRVVLTYEVHGAVTPLSDLDEVRWVAAGGFAVPARQISVVMNAKAVPNNLACFAGDPNSAVYCSASDMGGHEAGAARFQQARLAPGQVLTVVVGYPSGTTTGEPILDHRFSLSAAFQITPLTGGVLALLLVVLLGGLALLYRTRGRDARVMHSQVAAGDHPPVASGAEGGFEFTPPDGVRPGQIGTLIDEQADVVDVTATIIDLAVRGHILIEELPHERFSSTDWSLVKRTDAPAEQLRPYEKLLFDALFAGRDQVRLSELGDAFSGRLAEVRSALYDDVVGQGWFARRPDSVRTRWTTAGVAVTLVGVAATVALALLTHVALLGLAIVVAGAALAVGAQYMPAKTARGSSVLAHTLGFREYLHRADADEAPEDQRLRLFSRYLPYAVVFDNVDRWAQIVATSGAGGNGHPADNLSWYHGPAEWDLSNFADSMRTFTLTTSGAISATRQFRSF